MFIVFTPATKALQALLILMVFLLYDKATPSMRNMFSEQYGVEYDGAVDYLMKGVKRSKIL